MTTESPATLTIPQAAALLGISRNLGYALARSGAIPSLRLGQRRLLVPRHALESLLAAAAITVPSTEDAAATRALTAAKEDAGVSGSHR